VRENRRPELPLPASATGPTITPDDTSDPENAVFLLEPDRTPYDLNFRIFRTDVRVHPMFWVVSALLGWPYLQSGFLYLLLWVLCVFVSILIHELGHIFAGRYFGSDGYIILFSFGGLAVGSSNLHRRWQRVVVYLAGPGAQFILYGLLWGVREYIFPRLLPSLPFSMWPAVLVTLFMLLSINLFWPLLNLLPIWPLDGGKISREVCEAISPSRGVVTSLGISGALAGILAVHCFMNSRPNYTLLIPYLPWLGGLYMAIFFAMFCVQSFQLLQFEKNRRRSWDDDYLPWER
jgi:stage IV sporulation protein FB